ncbi:MAG: 3-methyl-2-oxobutanoate hydroxymethyltransferase [Deltaproteobacteria bacterium]|nr:3-methyl-2-oxobutanoate hydroxymethyltransferase [Deltaproteobacteria bacterium]
MKRKAQRICMLTAYDATFARLLDDGGADVLLVGDSLGMVIKGEENTLGVTVDEVLYHTRAVTRGVRRAHVVADMPFMSYQTSLEEGLRNAGRLVKEGGAESVKIEGGRRHADLVARLSDVGIPVMGHIGLTPQSVHAMGGFKVQGRGIEEGRQLLQDALALEDAGAYALVLEGIPAELAKQITETLQIPTIGIGAGPHCDGQVLVSYDLLGLNDTFAPRFVKRYERLSDRVKTAVATYVTEVQQGAFPTAEHSFSRLRAERGGQAARPATAQSVAAEPARQELAETIPLYPGVTRR